MTRLEKSFFLVLYNLYDSNAHGYLQTTRFSMQYHTLKKGDLYILSAMYDHNESRTFSIGTIVNKSNLR